MKLGKSHIVRVFDNQRVDIRHVNSRFNNRCTDKHVKLAVKKLSPHLKQLVFGHSSVCNPDFSLGNKLLQSVRASVNALNSVVNIVNLSAAAKLFVYCRGNNSQIVLNYIARNRLSVLRRLVKHAHIANSAHCHIKRSGNGSCRKRENIHSRKAFLEFVLMRNAEALFFINNYKSQILEFNVILNNSVRSYYKINSPRGKTFQNFFLLFRRFIARQNRNIYRKSFHSCGCGLIMLPRKNRCRRKKRALFSALYAFKRRTKRNFRFSKTDISAQKPLHRLFALHIGLDFINTPKL